MDLKSARDAAQQELVAIQKRSGIPLVLIDAQTMEKDWCWVFFYQSRDYAETGSPGQRLAGNGPILVEKTSGQLHVLGTARPLEDQLERLRSRD
jgi:Immunity protein 35